MGHAAPVLPAAANGGVGGARRRGAQHWIRTLAAVCACTLLTAVVLAFGCDAPRAHWIRAIAIASAPAAAVQGGVGGIGRGAGLPAPAPAPGAGPASAAETATDVAAALWAEAAAAASPNPDAANGPTAAASEDGGSGGGGAHERWRKRCPAGCAANGNCNHEQGRCECPWGYAGPACTRKLLPACALGPNATAVQCGELLPRACECLRQCHRLFCPGGECEAHRDTRAPKCFEVAAPEGSSGPFLSDGVFSDVPANDSLAGRPVVWFRGIGLEGGEAQERISRAEALQLEGGVTALPLSGCPGACGQRGQCVARGGEARCACWRGYDGRECEYVHEGFCLNGCGGRGDCVGGFCHCRPGFWGADCSRSRVFPPNSTRPAATGHRLYVYELPTHVAFDFESAAAFEFDAGFAWHHPNYIAYKHFKSMLMKDWAVRTENPFEANLFFVPAESYSYSSNTGDALTHLRRVMSYVRDAHPWFNVTGGRDHVLWLPNDKGACLVPPSDPLLGPPIKVTHFGMLPLTSDGADYDAGVGAAAGRGGGELRAAQDTERRACHRPSRDIVAAPFFDRQEALVSRSFPAAAGAAGAAVGKNGSLLFFAGDVRQTDQSYSGGARQELHRLFASHPDVRLVTGGMTWDEYESAMRAAKFCFAPYGHGWGMRLSEAVAMGCIPVIVQDGVQQPYEDLLPYHHFSIRLPKARLPQLVDLLRSITPDHYARLQSGLAAFWPALVWSPAVGGRAYNLTVLSLQRRATANLGGQYP